MIERPGPAIALIGLQELMIEELDRTCDGRRRGRVSNSKGSTMLTTG